jgi:hypothetical protein
LERLASMGREEWGYDAKRRALEEVPSHLGEVAVAYRSPLENACDIRGVLFNLGDQVLLALVEDRPLFAAIHREERVDLVRYRDGRPAFVAGGIDIRARLLASLVEGLEAGQEARTGISAGIEQGVSWIAQQADHEATQHLIDAPRRLIEPSMRESLGPWSGMTKSCLWRAHVLSTMLGQLVERDVAHEAKRDHVAGGSAIALASLRFEVNCGRCSTR